MTWSVADESIVIGAKTASREAATLVHGGEDRIHVEEEKAIAELKRLNARFTIDDFGRVASLDAKSREVLAVVPRLKDLTVLCVRRKPRMTDADMAMVSPAIQLTELTLDDAHIGDAGMAQSAP